MSIDDVIADRVGSWKKEKLESWENSIPKTLRGYDLDSLLKTRWSGKLTAVQTKNFKTYLDKPTMFLVLCGPSGMGKTVMGIEVCRRLLEENVCSTALYETAPQMFTDLSFGFREDIDAIDKYTSPDVLFIDDIGSTVMSMSETRKDGLWAIINQRWAMGKYTIFSTNLPPISNKVTGDGEREQSLMSYLGDSIWDRVVSSYTLITFSGTSLRKKQPKKRTTKTTTTRRSRRRTSNGDESGSE